MGETVVGLVVCLLLLYLVAWIMTMLIVTTAAEDKGYGNLNGTLWFIGLFGLIFTPGIIVAALPDKRGNRRLSPCEPNGGMQLSTQESSIESQLPAI